jgi:hypothetical protein
VEYSKLTPYHVHQCFHAVGHGTFMTGVVMDDIKGAFNWIYDCGSRSPTARTRALTRTSSWPVWPDPVNMLVLSHYDDDHVNGLEDLLKQRRVNCLVLPFSEWQQRVRDIASGGQKGVSASTAQLQLSPLAWLQATGLANRVGTLLLVRGGATEQPGDLDPMPLPNGFNPNVMPGEIREQDSHEQRDLRMIGANNAGAPSVQVIQHGVPVQPAGFPMEFMFYNAELSGYDLDIIKTDKAGVLISKKSKQPLPMVRQAIESQISALGLDKPLTSWPSGWRANLKKFYEGHFGSSGAAKNNISLCMYVAPTSNAQSLRPCRLFDQHDAPHPIVNLDAGSAFRPDRPAMLCTGDLRLDANVIAAMQSHFGIQRWGRIGVTQVPHHGSEHSWVSGNAKLLAPSAFVHCAPGKGAHPHKNVVSDLAGQTVFTADYQSSVYLKYHFRAP